ncbi:glycerol-3-phosphate dehydrogenase/oxidase [Cerasibacillus terrae]|uniref:Glycerol-3-phosphate dehydrogenase n=1 Tax=Cerasibacillus terrae TaxID=2498845 RepID=A0A5C8NUY6_9BACI|nr:glycerol-3-phosphate dehydrogenase/oxidase [Cerasibacillus terrae]TXL64981.1 glycerol-3-phosphate dehydrogenase/oxidase [Cerasibacillus terrae]
MNDRRVEKLSNFKRQEILNNLKQDQELDLIVIGGGITGAGIALDAATRGLKTAVLEMQDFAAGTSSRSTKLVHGGLRYLAGFEVKLVAEVGKERAIVYENGPHVTTPEWMMLPFHKGGTFGPFTTNIGLRMYDFLAGVKKSERRKMLDPSEALRKEPLLKKNDLKGAGYYVEYKTDDARLTLEVMKKAVEHGAQAINYMKVINFIYNDEGHVIGVETEDQLTGDKDALYAKKIINACGPWVDTLREIDGSNQGKHLYLTKGVHLVFSNDVFPLQQAIYFDAPDGRMVFAIPREGKTYVGTTDTPYDANIAHPTATVEDRDYIIGAIHDMFPSINITADDVESSWAGLRPLIAEDGKNPDEISRKDEIFTSDSGLLSIAGGKLTGYRKMAEQIVDIVVKQLKEEEGILYSESVTKHETISGGDVGGSKGFATFKKQKIQEAMKLGISEENAIRIVSRYGSNVDTILDIYQEKKEEAEKENIDRLVFAELIYGVEKEWVCKPVDFFIRRTGALFFHIDWVYHHKDAVTQYLAKTFEWTNSEQNEYEAELEQLLDEATFKS